MLPDFHKIGVVATTEFGSSVRTKAFFTSILLLPILVGSSIALQLFVMKRVDTRTRTVTVIDRTGAPIRPSKRRRGPTMTRRSTRRARRSRLGSSRQRPRSRDRGRLTRSSPWSSRTGSDAASSVPTS